MLNFLFLFFFFFSSASRCKCLQMSSAQWTLSGASRTSTRAPSELWPRRRPLESRALRTIRPSRRAFSSNCSPSDSPPPDLHYVQLLTPASTSSELGAPRRRLCVTFSASERANARMDVGTRRGPALTGLAVSVTLLFWVGGEVISGRLFFPAHYLKKKKRLVSEGAAVCWCLPV